MLTELPWSDWDDYLLVGPDFICSNVEGSKSYEAAEHEVDAWVTALQ